MPRVSRTLLAGLAVWLCACSTPTPQAPTPASPAPARPQSTAKPRPEQAPIGLVLLQIDESATPQAEATPVGLGAGRPTATPYATADTAWKYVTFTVAVENRADSARLVGIGGPDPQHTNLADAVLIAGDGMRYKAFHSYSSFGLRTATARSLNNYPVLLRLPPGFRAETESFGALTTAPPQRTALTFRVPAAVNTYRTLAIPPLGPIGTRNADDDIGKRLRALIGVIQPLDLAGAASGAQPVPPLNPPSSALGMGKSASIAGLVTVTLASAEVADPADFQARNRGWKTLSVALRYRNDDPQTPRTYAVSAWFFGDDGVVYSGDVPATGDVGRATAAPEPSVIAAWDGRTAGPDQVPAGQEQETRRAVFQVPNTLPGGYLVLAGDIDATFRIEGFGA